MSEINHIKNNNSKSYLKNIYNILFYDKKTQINFRNIFYEKVFDIDSKQNDFLELSFKSLYNMKVYQNDHMLKQYSNYLMKIIILCILNQ